MTFELDINSKSRQMVVVYRMKSDGIHTVLEYKASESKQLVTQTVPVKYDVLKNALIEMVKNSDDLYFSLLPEDIARLQAASEVTIDDLEPGNEWLDGSLYVGKSPETGTHMFAASEVKYGVTPQAVVTGEFNMNAHGHAGSRQRTNADLKDPAKDDGGFRLPTREEYTQAASHRKGGLYSRYLVHSPHDDKFTVVELGESDKASKDKKSYAAFLVRTEPRPA